MKHVILTDKGLFAINAPQKVTFNEIDEVTLSYKNTQWYKETGGYKDPDSWYKERLQHAIEEGVRFKDYEKVVLYFSLIGVPVIIRNKPYDIPDGYEVKIEEHGEYRKKYPNGSPMGIKELVQYAILVPKVVPCPKCRTTDFVQTCHDMRCPIRGEEPKVEQPYMGGLGMSNEQLEKQPKQQSIEEAANEYCFTKDQKENFIAGAKWMEEKMYSDMQEYAEFCIRCDREVLPLIKSKDWYEQFKQKP